MKAFRRKDRALDASAAKRLLAHGEYGILSTVGADGQPCGVPLNYVYRNDAIYFDSAHAGHKIEIDHISAKTRR